MLQEQVINEIKEIPQEDLIDVYKLIHQFRLNKETYQARKHKTVDEVFGKLYKPNQKTVSIKRSVAQ